MRKLIPLLILCGLSCPAIAKKGLNMAQLQVGGIRITPEKSMSSAFIHLAWTPIYKIKDAAFRGEFGLTRPSNPINERFWSVNYGVYAYHMLFSLVALEVGGGLQTWLDDAGGTHPLLSGNLVMAMEGGMIERLIIGYSRYFLPNNITGQLYIGIGFNI